MYRLALAGIGDGNSIVTQTDYQLEIRTSREHLDSTLLNQGLSRPMESYYAPNERLAEGVNIVVIHAGGEIIDADYFTISNGIDTVEFEYNDVGNDGLGGDGITDSVSDRDQLSSDGLPVARLPHELSRRSIVRAFSRS